MTHSADDSSNEPARAGARPRRWPLLVMGAACVGAWLWSNRPRDTAVAWQTDLDTAQKQAAAENRPVFIKFDSPSCGYCRQMDVEVFSRVEAAEALRGFIPVRVNTLRHPILTRRFGIQAVPAFAVLTPQGEVVTVTMGVMSLGEFTEFLERYRS